MPSDPDSSHTHVPSPGVAGLAHDLRLACMRISRRVRFESPSEVGPHHFSVLARLASNPQPLGDLAELERVRAPSMSKTVAGLVDLGLVQRDPDPTDGRVVVISLTDWGRNTLSTERAQRDVWMATRLEGLTPHEKAVLREATALLERVVSQ